MANPKKSKVGGGKGKKGKQERKTSQQVCQKVVLHNVVLVTRHTSPLG